MIRQVPNRFNPAQLLRMVSVAATEATNQATNRFRVNVAIGDFKRLAQLVDDYRLSSSAEGDSGKSGELAEVGESTGFEAVFALSRFADSSFIFDKNEKVARPGTSLPGGNNGGGGADERAAKTPIIVAEGTFNAQIELQCQRCLGNYIHRTETNFKFAFAANEITAELLPDTMDPVLLDEEGNIAVVDMFEDELLLRLPSHAVHIEESQCDFTSVPYREHIATEKELAQLAEDSKPENPFASLKGMSFTADSSADKADEKNADKN